MVRHVPDARGVRSRALWYGDQTRSQILWTDGTGREWRWFLFIPFSVSLKKRDQRDSIIERSLRNLLNPPQVSDWHETEFCTAKQVAQRLR